MSAGCPGLAKSMQCSSSWDLRCLLAQSGGAQAVMMGPHTDLLLPTFISSPHAEISVVLKVQEGAGQELGFWSELKQRGLSVFHIALLPSFAVLYFCSICSLQGFS